MISGATTLWLLVLMAGHSYAYIPGIASESECQRLYGVLRETRWVSERAFNSETHRCVPYQSIVR